MFLDPDVRRRTHRFPKSLLDDLNEQAQDSALTQSEIVRLGVTLAVDELQEIDESKRSDLVLLKKRLGLEKTNNVTNR